MGMTKTEIKSKFDEIVDFAGVERYIDTPVKRYSSGMTVRLGFAIAAYLEPEILVVDEVLAVGDAEFQKKAIGKMHEVSHTGGRTVLFVSHNMAAVKQLCTRSVVIKNGSIGYLGEANEAIHKYLNNYQKEQEIVNYRSDYQFNKNAFFKEIKILDDKYNERNIFFLNEPIIISFKIKILDNSLKYNVFCIILDKNLKRVFASESDGIREQMYLKINPFFLVRGGYSIHTFIHLPRIKQEDVVENICPFTVIDNGSKFQIHGNYDYGSVFGNCEWN